MGKDAGPRYQWVAAELRARVERGTYAAGEPLPSQPKLAKELGVSLATLRQGLDVLRDDGWVQSVQGGATRLAPPATRRALILEDDRDCRSLLEQAAHECGVEAVAVETADAAAAAARKGRFALLLLDVQLPGRDGISAAAELRQLQPDARLVFVTANPEHALDAVRRGIRPVEILPKPFELSEVLALLCSPTR
jgi:CheY-like chemotaxis protein